MCYGSVPGAEEQFPNEDLPITKADTKKKYKVSIFFSSVPRWEMYDSNGGFLMSYDVFENTRITHKLTYEQGKNPTVLYKPESDIEKDINELKMYSFDEQNKAEAQNYKEYNEKHNKSFSGTGNLPNSTRERYFLESHPEYKDGNLLTSDNIDYSKVPKPKRVSFFDKTIFRVCKDVTRSTEENVPPSTDEMIQSLKIAILSLKSFFDVQSALGYYGEVEFCIGACMPLEGMMFAMAELLGDSSTPKDIKQYSKDCVSAALKKYKDTFKWYTHSKGKWTFKVVYKYIFETTLSTIQMKDDIKYYFELKQGLVQIAKQEQDAHFGDSGPNRWVRIRGEVVGEKEIKAKITELGKENEAIKDAEKREEDFNKQDEVSKQGTLIFEANKNYLETFARNIAPLYELHMAKLKIQSQKHNVDNYLNNGYLQGKELRAAEGEEYYSEAVTDYEGNFMTTWELDQEIKRRNDEIEKYLKIAKETQENAIKAVVNEEMQVYKTWYLVGRIVIGIGSIAWPPLALVDFLIECVDFAVHRDVGNLVVNSVFDAIAFAPVIGTWVRPGLAAAKLDAAAIKTVRTVQQLENAGVKVSSKVENAVKVIDKGEEAYKRSLQLENHMQLITNRMHYISEQIQRAGLLDEQYAKLFKTWDHYRNLRYTKRLEINNIFKSYHYKEYMKFVHGQPNILSKTVTRNVRKQQVGDTFKLLWQQTVKQEFEYWGDFAKFYKALIPETEMIVGVYKFAEEEGKVVQILASASQAVGSTVVALWHCPYHGATVLLTAAGTIWTVHGAWANGMLIYRGYPIGLWDDGTLFKEQSKANEEFQASMYEEK